MDSSALRSKDASAMLRFVREAESFPDLASFRTGILDGLRELVPCDLVGYNEVDTAAGTSVVILSPDDAAFAGTEPTLARLAHQHPLIGRQLAGDMRTFTISDFLSVREFHRLELYGELYSRLGAEDQIAFGLPGRVVVGIAMNRSRRSFSARDRAVLEVLRPNLTQAWRHARARERARAVVFALEEGLEASGGAIVLVAPDGRLLDLSDAARQLLEAYFGRAAGLPHPLTEWIESRPGARPLVVSGSRGRLAIRRVESLDEERITTLLLSESRLTVPRIEALVALGLSRREAEVLQLAAAGDANDEIADRLGIRIATVRKHLERVYEKLGVHTRADAVRLALSV